MTPARSAELNVLAYFVALTCLLYVIDPIGPFFDIALTYVLKDHLHASLSDVALFRLTTALPVYAAVIFGLVRDRWSPLGRQDRGYFLLFPLLLALLMVWLAVRPLTLVGVSVGVVIAMLLTRFVIAAHHGLMARLAHEQAMAGRLAAVWQFTTFAVALGTSAASGLLAQYGGSRAMFWVVAAAALCMALFSLWRPRAVYGQVAAPNDARPGSLRGDLRRLATHRALYPAVTVMLLFQFSPGQGVVLQYYLVDRLHGSDAMYGYWYATYLAGFLPMFLLYGYLCQRVPFGRLLFWSAVVAVPQVMPLAFIHSAWGAVLLALPIGMLGGLMWAAINDLAMRACPPGLQGALMMCVAGVNTLGVRGGDWLGTRIYAAGGDRGFLWCALATTTVYAAILLVIRWIPHAVTATTDGQPWRAVR